MITLVKVARNAGHPFHFGLPGISDKEVFWDFVFLGWDISLAFF